MTVSFTSRDQPDTEVSVCLCCAGSQRVTDSDISDYEVDDGIGVVPPGAWWGRGSLHSASVFACAVGFQMLWDTDVEI